MPLVADRVFETTTTQGTGMLSLAGAQSGFRAFRDAVSNGDEVFYLIEQVDTAWEVGRGAFTLGTPDTLSRVQVLSSSAGGGAINFGAGVKNVVAVTPGAELNQLLNNTPRLDRPNTYTDRQVILGTGEATLNILGDSFVSPSIQSYRNSASDHGMVLFKSARGTRAAPADLNDGDRILTLSPRPRVGGIFSGISSLWAILRDAKSAVEWRFFNGGVVVGSPAGGYRGPGSINASQVYDDGVQIHPVGLGTPIATTSGTSHDFTGIRSDAKRVTLLLDRVSLSGSGELEVQIGSSSDGIETSGYSGRVQFTTTASGAIPFSSGFRLNIGASAAQAYTGRVVLELLDPSSNTWIASIVTTEGASVFPIGIGSKSLSGALDRVRTKPTGANAFDGGMINIIVE